MIAPIHLIVLVHGLDGAPGDLKYLEDELRANLHKDQALVVNASANHGRTKDGVEKGGLRLVDEIKGVVEAHPSLEHLSLIGNSLGGIYARYALAHLNFDPTDGTFLGRLKPEVFMTIASPHIGVRRYTCIPLPSCLHGLVKFVFGRSGEDLFLRLPRSSTRKNAQRDQADLCLKSTELDSQRNLVDKKPLLFAMATDGIFLLPLKSFKRRRLYANISKDMMVPVGTAAFQPNFKNGREIQLKGDSRRSGIRAYLCVTPPERTADEVPTAGEEWQTDEERMANSLQRCGWEKVGIRFPGIIPDAHNRVCAWSRNRCGRWLYKSGRVVMDDAVIFLQSVLSDSQNVSHEYKVHQ